MSGGPMELRVLLVVAAASLTFTALATAVYRRDPGRRRAWLAALAPAMVLAPWWPAAGFFTWPLGLHVTPTVLEQPLPWLLALVWWSIAAAAIARRAIRVLHERRRLLALPEHPDPTLWADCLRLAARIGLDRPVVLRQGAYPCASSLSGWTVVLPAAASGWSADARSAVLAHELTHLARRDDRQMLLVRLLLDWYWWMPWLRGLYRRYLEAMEESCDDRASALLPHRGDYVGGVVEAARSVSGGASRASSGADRTAALPALLGHSHLISRAARLLDPPGPSLRVGDGHGMVVATSLLFLLAVSVEPVAAPVRWPADARPIGAPASDAAAPRVTMVTQARTSEADRWQRVPASALQPLPVYPIAALERGIGGRVTVEVRYRQTPAGPVRASVPVVSSSDGTGLLSGAVARAMNRAGAEVAAGLQQVAAGPRPRLAAIPPGATIELRTVYRFIAGSGPSPTMPGEES